MDGRRLLYSQQSFLVEFKFFLLDDSFTSVTNSESIQ